MFDETTYNGPNEKVALTARTSEQSYHQQNNCLTAIPIKEWLIIGIWQQPGDAQLNHKHDH